MASHSSILAWKIPWTEEPGGLQSMWLQRIGHDWATEPEKAMATYSSTLAWKIPFSEGPGGLQSMGSPRIRHNWATSLSLFTFMHWRRKRQPTPVFLPRESQDRGAWWAAVYGVTQSRKWLKWLSSNSSRTTEHACTGSRGHSTW